MAIVFLSHLLFHEILKGKCIATVRLLYIKQNHTKKAIQIKPYKNKFFE